MVYRSARDSKPLEVVGTYNPLPQKPTRLSEEEARVARRSINPDAVSAETLQNRRKSPRPLPKLPPRRQTQPVEHEEDLIDFSDPPPSKPWLEPPERKPSPHQHAKGVTQGQRPSPSPPPPPKPAGLRSPAPDQRSASPDSANKAPPPRPRKPSTAIKPNLPQLQFCLIYPLLHLYLIQIVISVRVIAIHGCLLLSTLLSHQSSVKNCNKTTKDDGCLYNFKFCL